MHGPAPLLKTPYTGKGNTFHLQWNSTNDVISTSHTIFLESENNQVKYFFSTIQYFNGLLLAVLYIVNLMKMEVVTCMHPHTYPLDMFLSGIRTLGNP